MKKKTKIIIALIGILLLCSAFTAGRKLSRYDPNPYSDGVQYFVDPETGVNYLIAIERRDRGVGVGFTVRFNSDGTIMVTK